MTGRRRPLVHRRLRVLGCPRRVAPARTVLAALMTVAPCSAAVRSWTDLPQLTPLAALADAPVHPVSPLLQHDWRLMSGPDAQPARSGSPASSGWSPVGLALPADHRRCDIDVGLQALAAGGPDAVQVDPLAKALGVTRGGFYWHFEDRRALLEEMLDTWSG